MAKPYFYVRFWDNMGKGLTVVVKFRSWNIADRFVKEWKYTGESKCFNDDFFGEYYIERKNGKDSAVINGTNSYKTFKQIMGYFHN